MHSLTPGTEQIHVGPAGQVSMSQQHPLPLTKANLHTGLHQQEHSQRIRGRG